MLRNHAYDVVLLDLNLPGVMSGKAVLRRLRERGDAVPVLVLTASASLDQKVLCLEIGADDYLVKPVEIRELVARIQAMVRRQMPGKANTLQCADLAYDLRTRQFSLGGAELALPPRERSLLEALMLKNGQAVSRPRCRTPSSASTKKPALMQWTCTFIACARSSKPARPR